MNSYTQEELFDLLVEQGGPSINADGDCRYRGDGGRKCAAGWFLTDAEYRPEIEGVTILHLRDHGDAFVGVPQWLRDAQRAHDSASIWGGAWKDVLACEWDKHGLSRRKEEA